MMRKFALILLVGCSLGICCFGKGTRREMLSKEESKGPSSRVAGGDDAKLGEFPFMLRVAEGCGAVLITPTCALTAAHCVSNFFYYRVIAGDWDADEWEDTEQVRNACVTHHPGYNPNTLENDIAFLRTRGPFDTGNNTFVGPIQLPGEGSVPSTSFDATVMGWGGPAAAAGRRQGDKVLKKAVVATWSDQDCRKVYGNDRIKDSMLCAGNEEDDVNIFEEDSGGPLIMNSDAGSPTLVGLISHQITVGIEHPGVYTEIIYFIPWIHQLMNQNDSVCYYYKY